MTNSQKNTNALDLSVEIVDLDELLRLLCGAANEDVCMRGLAVSLYQAKKLSGKLRQQLECAATE
ncbi:hypothetical protein A6E13_16355 [Aliivibrio fischeri]|uniref:hypothetical protein n=1 Tax=Aliivibrio fischeri TaxID=668 RepID=UPI00080DD6D3|nr:hypothetical protein [Aliivibrio fischeri]OCH31794.1 hypothetical protein A6E13_16355 [Aliivibrio fischeri]